MSGGHCDYVFCKIDEYLVGNMEDEELDDLMRDVAKLAHDLEWYLSCDTSRESYMKSVQKFKEKWFRGNRNDRLKGYIDADLERTRHRLYGLIGVTPESNVRDKHKTGVIDEVTGQVVGEKTNWEDIRNGKPLPPI